MEWTKKKVEQLRREVDAARDRVTELERVIVQEPSIGKVKAAAAELQPEKAALATLEKRLAEGEKWLADKETEEQAKHDEAARQEFTEQARVLIRHVASLCEDLEEDFRRLDAVQAALVDVGGSASTCALPGILRQAVGASLGYWRWNSPETLGLPPKPTAREARIHEAEAKLAAAKGSWRIRRSWIHMPGKRTEP